MNTMSEKVLLHEWLKHPGHGFKAFHAYLNRQPGTPSACGGHPPIESIFAMELPGDNSVCCGRCFAALYGVDLAAPPKGKK